MVYGNIPSHIKAPEGVVLKPSKVDRRLIGKLKKWYYAEL
jgi:hypothetical protein